MADATFPVIACRGTPRRMGREYGEQARDMIRRNAERFAPADRLGAAGTAAAEARAYLKTALPDVAEELEGLAEGSGVPAEAVVFMNACLYGFGAHAGCTSMAVRGGPDGPLLGKNNDGGADEENPFVIRTTSPENGIPMIQVTYAGWLSGLDAMNAEGLANGHDSVGSVFDRTGKRPDIRLAVYDLFRRCRATDEFLERLAAGSYTGKGYNVVVVDRAGDAAVVEAAVPLVAVRARGEPFVYATNHFESDALRDADRRAPAKKPISVYRYGYLRWVARTAPPEDADALRRVLRSREPWAPCRHGGPHGSHTLWSIVGLPARGELHVACGAPDACDYRAFDLSAL